ncbi:MAG TPA: hypothetical protein PKY82_21820 [Pyrinomonadaceae bacterium]|nr:hypothetical protein [Pyrinomonadaceae bacterium]
MTNTELENRIAVLEAEVALLKNKIEKKDDKADIPWWKQRIGIFADDPAHEEAMRLGREYRESQKMVYDEDED